MDALLWKELPPPLAVASVPPAGPWAEGPPIFWGWPSIKLVNESEGPVFVQAFSVAGISLLDHVEPRFHHLGIQDFPTTLEASLPLPAGTVAVSVQIRLEPSQRVLTADLPAWVDAGYRCYLTIRIEPARMQATPCVPTGRVDTSLLDD